MNKYKVEITIANAKFSVVLSVMAKNENEAKEAALEIASKHLYGTLVAYVIKK